VITLPIVIGLVLGFGVGATLDGPSKPKLYTNAILLSIAWSVILLVAMVPALPAFAFGASMIVTSCLALALPETNRIKSVLRKALK
jgi:hypothetical protein